MASKAQKVRVGTFVVVTAALLATVLIVFGGLRFWETHESYRIVFSGSVYGLEAGAQVYLNGILVGRVERIAVAKEDLGSVDVTISVEEGTPVHTDTRALLQFAGITGLKVVDLQEGSRTAPRLPPGGTIAQGETTLDRLERQAKELADQSAGLMQSAHEIVENLVTITDPEKFEGMTEIIEQARITANRLASTSAIVEGMVVENRATLLRSLEAVEAAATSTSALVEGEVATFVTSARGILVELGSFLRGTEGEIRSSVFDLRQASRNFKELSREVRQRPSRLLFSDAPPERELP